MIQGTKKALALWEKIPGDIRVKLLNNAWCRQCRQACGIADAYLEIFKGNLVVKGSCVTCGSSVARLHE